MLTIYPAIFYKEKNGNYSVIFPDLNHLSTSGGDLKEAMEMAVDCLAGYVYDEKKAGNELPLPTSMEKFDIHCEDDPDDDYEKIFTSMVSVDVEEYARKNFEVAVKKTISIPKWLDEKAKARKINFSKTLQGALLKELNLR